MNNTTTILEGDELLDNQLELVIATTVAGTLYGIAFTLFCLYIHALVPRLQDQDRKRKAIFMLLYSTVIMLCGLYNLVGNAWSAQDAYIKHGNYPGGPSAYIATTFQTPLIIIGFSCQVIVDTLTSIIQIWRVWVVWSATRYASFAIILPTLCFLTFTGLNLRIVILAAIPTADSSTNSSTDIAELAIQGATTIICTGLISLFLLVEQWRQSKLIGKAQGSTGYMKVVTILVESYALESIWLLLIAALATLSVVVDFFTETQIYIEILAYLLVQYQVASGKACESQREPGHMSSLHWNHSTHATTTWQSEATTETGVDGRVSDIKPRVSNALPGSIMA